MNIEIPAESKRFGRHLRSLRRGRKLTQQEVAERSNLSPDTIRRLEHGSFSPSRETLRKVATGLDMRLSTLFSSYELAERDIRRELVDLVERRSDRDIRLATRVLRTLFAELNGFKNGEE